MSKYTNLKDLFKAIANAIRGKEESTGEIIADDFPERIAAIEAHDAEDSIVSRTITSYKNDRITEVGIGAFFCCRTLENIVLPNVVKIGRSAFEECTLVSVDLPNVEWIDNNAFISNYVEKLTFKNLSDVGELAFAQCSKLVYFDMYGGNAQNNGSIGSAAFSSSVLRTLIIRSESLSENNECPCWIVDDSLYNTPIESGTGYIYVPASMVDAYKADEKWSVYANQIRAIEDYPEITGG